MEVSLCRCCLAQGLHKNLNMTYTWCNTTEVYANMLQECFNIVLSPQPQNGICDKCVSSLRAALAFKQGVLQAEHQLLGKLSGIKDLHVEGNEVFDVKVEPKSDDDDSDNYLLADVRDRSIEKEIKIEIKEESSKKRARKRKKTLVKSEPDESIQDLMQKLGNIGTRITSKKKRSLMTKIPTITPMKLKISSNMETKNWPKLEKSRHQHNIITILENSNVVPFRYRTSGYLCGYCDEGPYLDPKDLREHVEGKHKKERSKFITASDHSDYTVQIDVADLKCSICEDKMENLGVFKEHLIKIHNKTLYKITKDYLQQFKLKKEDVYDCVMCSATYETFKMLKQHMNQHYSNYSCDKCDKTFASKRSLGAHLSTHIEGSYKCDYCEKVFTNKNKKFNHEKSKHLGNKGKRNCTHCSETFTNYYQRNQHLVKVHNLEAKYKCNVCDKSYVLKSLLMYHIKKNHLMERNCQCSECGYRFFSKKALKAHMVKHTGEKDFICTVCNKSYARKYTLREHMRIHYNDRRFRCDVCGLTFVQKCSLKSHLLSNHGISMAASDIACVDTTSHNGETQVQ